MRLKKIVVRGNVVEVNGRAVPRRCEVIFEQEPQWELFVEGRGVEGRGVERVLFRGTRDECARVRDACLGYASRYGGPLLYLREA